MGGAVLDGFHPSSPMMRGNPAELDGQFEANDLPSVEKIEWENVKGLADQQRRALMRLSSRGVYWKHPSKSSSVSALYTLFHGGDVEADGNCLFTAALKAMRLKYTPQDLRKRVVKRFREDYERGVCLKEETDLVIKHLYAADLNDGWGVHIVQEVKLLAVKADREALDESISDLVRVGVSREAAAEAVYKERCIAVNDGNSWAKYMSVTGNADDEYDIITLQYTQEGLMNVEENREGHAAAFGDDIAIESLATEFKREIFVVQAHGSDAMVGEENCLFFLPHSPREEVFGPPVFLLMKGTGWCGAGADHYEPLIAFAAPVASQEKAAIVL
ncbi:hypothetical protein SUGI_1185840 [Cryptomeria japonica]|uniref:uncharacterized protein LOC131040025 n=1 Tax=Cryptomeria japonica TaxID=3369 RepID=UPI002414A11A|nr:uncharacterized protein LOC131040025 [Cryptomeria japonica]GLJ55257.1 hypothetical protein SUGI_1185840 [Cryptomeria japonica]